MSQITENTNIEKKANGRRIFWICYAFFIVIIAIAICLALLRVNKVLKEYEAKQPEKTVEEAVTKLKSAAKNDKLQTVMSYPEIAVNYLDEEFTEISDYEAKLKGARDYTYTILSGGYSDSGQTYKILADGEPVAVLSIVSAGEEKKLAILNVTDWRVKSIEPILSYTTYNYTAEVPEGFTMYLNGQPLAEGTGVTAAKVADGTTTYLITDLHSEPTFAFTNPYGEEVRYNIANNFITVVNYAYDLTLPEGFTVYAGEQRVPGSTGADGKSVFTFDSPYNELTIKDSYGHPMTYKPGDPIKTADYTLTVPDNFTVRLDEGFDSSLYIVGTEENSKYQYVSEYVGMPGLVTFLFASSLEVPQITITDNRGESYAAEFKNGVLRITDQAGEDELPESIRAEVDPIYYAKMWSLFSTDDLDNNHGFNTIKQILIPSSYLYDQAYSFAHSVDITFISNHRMDDPPFSAESMSNVVVFSDDCFSCDIYLSKEMELNKQVKHITNITNATFYFVKYDGSWKIVDMQDIVNQ